MSNSQDFFLNPALYVVATPIGNFGDITLRAIQTLKQCDFVICEDSRVTNKLLFHLKIKKPLIIYNDHSDNAVRMRILQLIREGKALALVSDAGTPLISDPGYKLVSELLANEVKVISIPGASSVIAALSISAIESDRFLFAGFIPNAKAAKENFLKELVNINSSLIFFESAHRIAATLELMLKIFGNVNAAIVREITKIHEETKRDNLENLVKFYQKNKIKGEIVILLSNPKVKNKEIDYDSIDRDLKAGMKKFKPKDLVSLIADNYQINKKVIYQRMLEII